ncbi:MAG TPA: TlpA disulfide reductase family protein [Bryobacterales bacterium]|nr:TlpA disulfide reductase family protein [Bryobacterales bacterium]
MAIAKTGIQAPDFTLPDMAGKPRPLRELSAQAPIVLAFFKISCPVCQYTFPFLERLHKQLGGSSPRIFGISQDARAKTGEFNRQFGVSFPVLLDSEDENYPVSNAYGITHVPSLFLIEPDGSIGLTSSGWVKSDIEEIARRFGAAAPFQPGEKVETLRPG